jgi:hypothetical protein
MLGYTTSNGGNYGPNAEDTPLVPWLKKHGIGAPRKLICSATSWVNPLAAPHSNFVCARILAQKHTDLPARSQRKECASE